jgi:hypothetical protein
MDYFELINSSKEAELAYANWLYQLPAERKAQMMCDTFQFGIETVLYNYHQEHPYHTEAEARMFYMEQNLKPFFSESTWDFIKAKMEEKVEEEWKKRFKAMKEDLDWSYADMAKIMNSDSPDAIKSSVSRKIPGFAKLAVGVYEEMRGQEKKG